jgi:hypothetical protein
MSTYFAFGQDDIVRTTLKSNPSAEFYIYRNEIFYDNYPLMSGAFTGSVPNVPPGHINLYEYNVDRTDQSTSIPGGTGFVRPFITKGGYLAKLKTISSDSFNDNFLYGDTVTGMYAMSASISREYFTSNHEVNYFNVVADKDNTTGEFNRVVALKNTLNHYSNLSKHFLYQNPSPDVVGEKLAGAGGWDKGVQAVNLISIPSIFYGSSIEKGTVQLDFYISGTLAAQLRDINKNGELIQVGGTSNLYTGGDAAAGGSGSVAGVVLYDEGFLVLTGSWRLNTLHEEPYNGVNNLPSWLFYGVGAETASLGYNIPSSSFALKFSGSTETNVTTLFAHAQAGELNHSNNPTYIQFSQSIDPITGSNFYKEPQKLLIKNTISGAFTDLTESFRKQTFISKIKLYDEDFNCIGVAKLATPLPKQTSRDVTFKLKLDT